MQPRRIVKIHYTSHFKKAFQKLPRQEQEAAIQKEQIFRQNVFDSRLKTHKLHGRLKDQWSFSVSHKYRILFAFVKPNEALFLDAGDHALYQ